MGRPLCAQAVKHPLHIYATELSSNGCGLNPSLVPPEGALFNNNFNNNMPRPQFFWNGLLRIAANRFGGDIWAGAGHSDSFDICALLPEGRGEAVDSTVNLLRVASRP